jgi:carbon-monoxide dehydrogenase large subunit
MTGTGTFTDDIVLPNMAHAAILRSPYAHARITHIDTARAGAAPGVLGVYTAADTEGALKPIPGLWLVPGSDLKIGSYPAFAKEVVRYVGDCVAVVVAETRYQAQDALDLIDVDYEPLPTVVDPQWAVAADAPQLHRHHGQSSLSLDRGGGDVEAAFKATGAVVVKERIIQQPLIPTAMEPRSALAQWVPATGELTLWNTTQNPHIVRFACSVVTGVPEDKLRVIAPEVGGGFGSKIAQYPGDFITVFCAMKLGRPVKWTETRRENYQATTPGATVQEVELATR